MNMDDTIKMFINWNGTTKNVTIRENEPKKNKAAIDNPAANKMAPDGTAFAGDR